MAFLKNQYTSILCFLFEEDEEFSPSNSSPSDLLAAELRNDERALTVELGDDERESSGVN